MKELGIKLYADGANIEEIYTLYVYGKIQGITTNPTLLRKAGILNYEPFAKKLIELIPDIPVSFEVFSDDPETMEKEARKISSWGNNVYVKIPVTHTNGISTSTLINKLSVDGIKLNVTAILTFNQVQTVLHALSNKTPAIVSVFAGRIADTGIDPTDIMRMSSILTHNRNVELLWASTREALNIKQAIACNCDIITVTPDILKKVSMFGKDLTELSLETVQMFHNDAKEAGYKII